MSFVICYIQVNCMEIHELAGGIFGAFFRQTLQLST
jgi:hypothetical protein